VAVTTVAASVAKSPAASDDETLSSVLRTVVNDPAAMLAQSNAATAQEPGNSNSSADAFSFTELELEESSILHAVEAAAAEGLGKPVGAKQGVPALEADRDEGTEEPAAEALPQIPLFSDLPPDAFVQLFERCPLRRYAMGEEIIAQGTMGHCFYVICAGSVAVFRRQDGKRTQITTLPEGSFFGEIALLSGSPRAASVESASDETQLLEISTSLLTELSRRYPTVARALRKFYRQRLLSNVMNTSRLFQPFNKADRRELVRRFRWRDVRKGEVIVREGTEADGLYVVLSGEVEVRKGHQTVLAKLNEGDLFGEISLLTKAAATATVISTRRTSLLCLPRADFDSLILGHPQVLMLVSELTDERQGKALATPQQSLMI
jgi:CRP-like cAMP-binding protein